MTENIAAARPDSSRRNLVLFLTMRGFGAFAAQMLDVAVGWHVYAATGSAMSLGFIGLAQFLPLLVFLHWSGQASDRFDRRKVAAAALLGQSAASLAIFVIALLDAPIWLIYPALFALGSARAFSGPANSALLPEIVDKSAFSRAIAMSTMVFQTATIAGPALGGLLYGVFGIRVFLICVAMAAVGAPVVMAIRWPGAVKERCDFEPAEKSALAGLRYIRSNKVVLGAISLDLFAVLFGGVTALLPIYAHDILMVGPTGLGFLRAAPAMGAILVGLALTVLPLRRRVGPIIACDVVSMVVRQTLVQLATPNEMRGRVAAVNFLFIGASNQLGEFESGFAAALLGAVGAALLGGVASLVVVVVWAVLFPQLRKADAL